MSRLGLSSASEAGGERDDLGKSEYKKLPGEEMLQRVALSGFGEVSSTYEAALNASHLSP